MSSPQSTGHRPEAKRPRRSSTAASGPESKRSRKGCPECRQRKIKCDEKRPECGQCLRSGRSCHVIDSLFRPHCYTFLTTTSSPSSSRRQEASRDRASPRRQSRDVERPQSRDAEQVDLIQSGPANEPPVPSPSTPARVDTVVTTWNSVNSPSLHSTIYEEEHTASVRSQPQPIQPHPIEPRPIEPHPIEPHPIESRPIEPVPIDPIPIAPVADPSHPNHFNADALHHSPIAAAHSVPSHHCGVPNSLPDDDHQNRYEIAFFLRYFSEVPGHWMDVLTEQQSYFSQHVVLLSHMSTLVRYAACAVAAKQLGQMSDPLSKIRQTQSHKFHLKAFSDSKLDFLWYGAKYYEKAIQLLAKQISHEELSTSGLSPCCIYNSGLSVSGDDHSLAGETDDTSSMFQVLAACMLCQYEDLSATMRARSGHLGGIYKLFSSHLHDTAPFQIPFQPPEPVRAFEACFWYFVLNDMLDSYTSRKRCRVDTENLPMWRKMGLPLNEAGRLTVDYVNGQYSDCVLFRALVRIMCQLMNLDMSSSAEWTRMNDELERWHDILPSSFHATISWTDPAEQEASHHSFAKDDSTREIWYCNDLCAMAMMFYHMARIILLIHRPLDIFLTRQPQNTSDLLASVNSLQRDIRQHAMEIVPIARAMPADRVRKYMLQPLYVAGRCFADANDRQNLLKILRQIEGDLGSATEYRMKDLSGEWGIPFEMLNSIGVDEGLLDT